LTKKTGVKLTASESPMHDTMVVVRYEGTLNGFMNALGRFFAIDKEHPASWSVESFNPATYDLDWSESSNQAARTLMNERQTALSHAMDQAVREDNRWVKHLASLTDQERFAIYSGRQLTFKAAHFGGRRYLNEVLQRDAPNWSDDTQVTYSMEGHSPLTRMFVRRFEDIGGQNLSEERFALSQICPQLAPERQQQEWCARYGDPAPRDTRQLKILDQAPPPQEIARRDLLLRIAEKAGVNLIADDYGQTLDESKQPTSGTIDQLLDAACQFQFGGGQTPDTNHGSFWRKVGDTYLVRSLAWPEEE
jgi:hypothetical protein